MLGLAFALLAAQPAPPAPAAIQPAPPAPDARAIARQRAEWKRQYGEGPYPDETEAFLASKPEPLRPYWANLWRGGERNAVVNFERLGLAAMEVGDYRTAEAAFDAALLRIESVYAKDRLASRARDTFAKEANKDFKGEPYERAMAYYYRGLLYLRAGDYGNARAAFKGAEYQDTVSESEEFQGDFAMMNYLIGWAGRCQSLTGGDVDGAADFAAARAAQPDMVVPPPAHNLLMISETGAGPIKAQDGAMREKLVFRSPEAASPERETRFRLGPNTAGSSEIIAQPLSSLSFQATTRGGRAIDGILRGKASFKSTTAGIGNAALQAGFAMMTSRDEDTRNAGAVASGVGLLFALLSSAARADADIRHWDQLPETLAVATAVRPKDPRVEVRFIGANGPLPMPPAALMQGGDARCGIIWARSRSALVPGDVPGDDPRVRAAVAKRRDAAAKDKMLRNSLSQL